MSKIKRASFSKAAEPLAETAYRKLEEFIVTLKLAPGSKWSEEDLVELISVGRTPVREAVKRLHNDSLLTVLARYGVMIAEINLHQQLLVVELRRDLEMLITEQAHQRASIRERCELGKMIDDFEAFSGTDIQSFLQHDLIVNQAIAGLAGNPFASKALGPLLNLSRRFFFKFSTYFNDQATLGELQASRARAISEGSKEDALKCAEKLMDFVHSYTYKLI